jgi:hypothetical protein
MRIRLVGCILGFAVLVGLGGCGNKDNPQQGGNQQGGSEVPDLASILTEGRDKLNERCNSSLTTVRTRNEQVRKRELKFELLKEIPAPLVPAVFQKTKFDAELGISVPDYGEASKSIKGDEALAIHYARFGDLRGAEAVAPASKDKYGKYAFGLDIPIEWTRCVSLLFEDMISRAAEGKDYDAIRNIIKMHQKLQEIFKDDKAKQSLAGQTLLPLGRSSLLTLVEALREKNSQGRPNMDITKLVDDAESALNSWGVMAAPPVSLEGSKEQWTKALAVKNPSPGRVLVCDPPDRAFDLLNLPFPREDALFVLLFFPKDESALEEITVVYTTEVLSTHGKAKSLAGLLANYVPTSRSDGDDDEKETRQRWNRTTVCDTRLVEADRPIGGWVRFRQDPAAKTKVPRALGAVKLDWSFDTNRLNVAPQDKLVFTGAQELVISNPETLATIAKASLPDGAPLPEGKLSEVGLQRLDFAKDLIRQVRYRYEGDARFVPMATPYWSLLGPSEWSPVVEVGPGLQLFWESPVTRLTVRIPPTRRDAEVLLTDPRDVNNDPKRIENRRQTVVNFENEDRRVRIQAGKPALHLVRKIDVPAGERPISFELGMKSDAAKQLVRPFETVAVIEKKEADGSGIVIVTNATQSPATPYLARQVMMRFQKGKDGEALSWIRVRYETGTGTGQPWPAEIFQTWQKCGGVSLLRPYGLAGLYGEEGRSISQYTYWRDDLTEVSYLRDPSGGVEVTLATRPEELPNYRPTAYVPTYLPGGPYPNIVLGMSVTQLDKMGLHPSEKNLNEYAFSPPADQPYDYMLITANENRVVSILARYRPEAGKPPPTLQDIQQTMLNRWGRQLRDVGWPSRSTRVADAPTIYNSFVWVDGASRYRLSWSPDEKGRRTLLAEWKDMSLLRAESAAAAKAGGAATGNNGPTSEADLRLLKGKAPGAGGTTKEID